MGNSCKSSSVNSSCSTSSSSFPCTSVGYFPGKVLFISAYFLNNAIFLCKIDPENCSQYFICDAAAGRSRVYECPKYYVYNAITQACKLKFWLTDCVQINCTYNKNKYVVYTGDRSYYAYCMGTEPLMFRCADPDNFVFNPVSEACEFVCKVDGRVADIQDEMMYYECYRVGFALVSRHMQCPIGFVFNNTTKLCARSQL